MRGQDSDCPLDQRAEKALMTTSLIYSSSVTYATSATYSGQEKASYFRMFRTRGQSRSAAPTSWTRLGLLKEKHDYCSCYFC